jgi:tetratricopeptide (TPR) repeat protein
MKEKWMPHIIAVTAFVVFIVLGLACATSDYRDYSIPQAYLQTYSETVNVPGQEAADIGFKINLFLLDNIMNNNGVITPGYYSHTKLENGESKIKLNLYRRDFLGNIGSNFHCIVYIITKPEQYQIDFSPYKEISWEKSDKSFKLEDWLLKRDADWQSLAAHVKQAVLIKLSDHEIYELVQNGYDEYKKGKYDAARKSFIKAVMAAPNNEYALMSLGYCFSNVVNGNSSPKKYYSQAIDIYKRMPGNPKAEENIKICQELISRENARLEQERQLREAQRQQEAQIAEAKRQQEQEENWEAINRLANSIAQSRQNQSGGNTGSQGQAGSSSGASSSSSSSGSSNINVASMQGAYNTREKATIQSLDTYRKARSDYPGKGSLSEVVRLYNAFRDQQKGLTSYRLECNKKGADIRPSYYETVNPDPPPNR